MYSSFYSSWIQHNYESKPIAGWELSLMILILHLILSAQIKGANATVPHVTKMTDSTLNNKVNGNEQSLRRTVLVLRKINYSADTASVASRY